MGELLDRGRHGGKLGHDPKPPCVWDVGTRAGWARDRHAIQRLRSKPPTPRYGPYDRSGGSPKYSAASAVIRDVATKSAFASGSCPVRRRASGRWSKEVRRW